MPGETVKFANDSNYESLISCSSDYVLLRNFVSVDWT